jgi:D-glycero-D-manno-heptose 1,7-bisphosphate phosphatase
MPGRWRGALGHRCAAAAEHGGVGQDGIEVAPFRDPDPGRAGGQRAGAQAPRPALFLDRDGVLNRLLVKAYVTRWEEFEWLPAARAALRLAHGAGWLCVVVTNQAGVGRGLQSQQALDAIHARMRREAAAAGGRIAAVYACPHRPEDGCGCRKPQPGLLHRAAAELNLDLTASYLVGDSAADVGAAEAAGVSWLLVRTGAGEEEQRAHPQWPRARICRDVLEAVERVGRCPAATGRGR